MHQENLGGHKCFYYCENILSGYFEKHILTYIYIHVFAMKCLAVRGDSSSRKKVLDLKKISECVCVRKKRFSVFCKI